MTFDATLERLLHGRCLADRYRIGEVIGRGGMSTVFSATDERLGRTVALKAISLPARSDEERRDHRERFRREAAAAAQIPPHPNVVQVYDYGTDAALDLDFLVMEWLRGIDLKEALATRRFTEAEAMRIVLEATRGLAAGHRAGFVHRDVKPANVFLVGDGSIEAVKLLDFGIAKAVAAPDDDELTRPGSQPHSPAYASPEQLRGDAAVTPASDVYQLARIARELFGATGAGPHVPASLVAVLDRAADPDPDRRPPDASALADALAGAWHAAPVAHREPATADVPSWSPADPAVGDETLLDAPAVAAAPGAPAPIPHPERGVPIRRRSISRPRAIAAAAAVAALVAVGALALRGGGAAAGTGTLGEPPQLAELDAEFRGLYRDAAAALQAEAEPSRGSEAAQAVQSVVLDLYQAIALGELGRHMAHYAGRVDLDGRRNTRASSIQRDRERLIGRYPEREITIERHAIEFPEADRARVLVDQRWRFGGERMEWQGSARQELELARREGRWLVVAERVLDGPRWDRPQ